MTFVTQRDFSSTQVDRSLVAFAAKAERVVLFDVTLGFSVEQFVGIFTGREKANPRKIDSETVDRFHAQDRVNRGVVVLFDPVGELFVEFIERRKIELSHEKLIADTPEEAFDLSFRRSVSHGRMTQDATDSGAYQRDFLATVNRSIVHQQLLGKAAFVECTANGPDHRVDVFLEEELAMTEHTTGIVDKRNQLCLTTSDVRPKHRVGLPKLVCILHAERQANLVFTGIFFE